MTCPNKAKPINHATIPPTILSNKIMVFIYRTVPQSHLSRLFFLSKGCKQVPPELIGGKILWAHPDGSFLNAKGQKLKPCLRQTQNASKCHTRYPFMTNFSSRLCHHLIWETFVGPRTPGMEIDHINGDKMDWSLANLQEVTPAENRKRAKLLRILRFNGRDPKQMSRDELLEIFKKYDFVDPQRIDLNDNRRHECYE